MAGLNLKHIYKVYQGGVKAVNDFNMEIYDKEFIVFVGPSGCGKSTTLRMIAGLEDITAGDLMIGDEVVNSYFPKDRNIAMVFQNYALYPHMTVYNNIAYALKIHHFPKEEIEKRVLNAAEILGITDYLDRKPKALSGGQRQRVALGRAIVREPKVFLLDEPLSNLDAKLRASMRTEITKLHDRLQTTFIYVTHDQVEAMTMGTRIVVMRDGFIQQIDTPKNLFNYPANKFVAGFIGTPQMNFYNGTISLDDKMAHYNLSFNQTIDLPLQYVTRIAPNYMDGSYPVIFGVRPDNVDIYDEKLHKDCAKLDAKVDVVEALGSETIIYANFNCEEFAEATAIRIKTTQDLDIKHGDIIKVAIDTKKIHVFDGKTEKTIKVRVPKATTVKGIVTGKTVKLLNTEIELPEAIASIIKDGSASFVIPSNAVNVGEGEFTGKVEIAENIDGKVLYEMKVGDSNVFAFVSADTRSQGDLKFAIDFSRVKIIGEDYEIKPISRVAKCEAVIAKDLVEKKNHNFVIGETLLPMSENLFIKVKDVLKKEVYTTNIVLKANSKDLVIGEGNFSGVIESILDYGTEKYALVNAGSFKFYIIAKDFKKDDTIKFSFNLSKTQVIDATQDIILA